MTEIRSITKLYSTLVYLFIIRILKSFVQPVVQQVVGLFRCQGIYGPVSGAVVQAVVQVSADVEAERAAAVQCCGAARRHRQPARHLRRPVDDRHPTKHQLCAQPSPRRPEHRGAKIQRHHVSDHASESGP